MSVTYRMTIPEMNLLYELLSEGQRLFQKPPEEINPVEWREAADKGLQAKGYLRHQDGEIVIERVIAGIVKAMMASDVYRLGESEEERIYIHPAIVLAWQKERRSKTTYRLIPFPTRHMLLEAGYEIGEELL